MTIVDARNQARRYSRIGPSSAPDDTVNNILQDAIDEFSNDVGGFPAKTYIDIAAAFDTRTNFALRFTITGGTYDGTDEDIVLTATNRTDATGTQVASDFQTSIQAAIGGGTVAWTNFYFTFDFTDATSVVISSPTTTTYADAGDLLGVGGTYNASSFNGSFPEDCTIYATLPDGLIEFERVEWDGKELRELQREWAQSPESSGEPNYYHIRGNRIYLIPSPTQQGIIQIWYKGRPTAIDFEADTSLPTDLPEQYQKAIPFLAGYYLLLEQHDIDNPVAGQMRANYEKIMRQYKVSYSNRHTMLDVNGTRGSIPRVLI